MHFSDSIINWYLKNKRDLPWRETKNPYYIWVSEIILQQTRVNQGIAYYYRFIENFPTVTHLAKSEIDKVLKMWEGLGYYSRARNMHSAAKYILQELNGKFPDNYADLLKLKGVGEYTAAAIASIAFKEPVAVVDGNVYRVLGRYLAIKQDITSSEGKKTFKKAATNLIDKNKPDLFNQAIMEFGALHCTVHNPNCDECVLNDTCIAYSNNTMLTYPVKLKKTKVRNRYFTYFIIKSNDHMYCVQKREANDIWKNLYEFPLLETENRDEVGDIINDFSSKFQLRNLEVVHISKDVKHVLSHQRIFTRFIHVEVNNKAELNKIFTWASIEKINTMAFPRLIDRYLQEHIL